MRAEREGEGGVVGVGTKREGYRDHRLVMPKEAPYMCRAAVRAKLKEHGDDHLISARAGGHRCHDSLGVAK